MKFNRIYRLITGVALLLSGFSLHAQELLSDEPIRDSLIIQYYFGFASAWDDTVYYTNLFYRYQDTLDKKDHLEMNWDRYIKHDLRLYEHTGFLMGPFYDSSYAVLNRQNWLLEIPDTLPGKEIFYMPIDGHGSSYRGEEEDENEQEEEVPEDDLGEGNEND